MIKSSNHQIREANHDQSDRIIKFHETKLQRTLMVRACSETREALAKVSSSTKTAFLRRSFCRESRFEAISVMFSNDPFHLSSLPPICSSIGRIKGSLSPFLLPGEIKLDSLNDQPNQKILWALFYLNNSSPLSTVLNFSQ